MDSTAIRPNQEQFPRQSGYQGCGTGVLYIRDLVANQQLASVEMTKAVKSLAHKAKSQGISEDPWLISLYWPSQHWMNWALTQHQRIGTPLGPPCSDICR